MKIKIDFGPDTDVLIEYDEKGEPIALVLTPKFSGRSAKTVVGYGISATDSGKVLDRFALLVSGANGRLIKKNRTSPVKALVDMTEGEAKPATDKHEQDRPSGS